MILNSVDQALVMFNPYAKRKRLGFDEYSLFMEDPEDITSRMTGRKHDSMSSNMSSILCHDAPDGI